MVHFVRRFRLDTLSRVISCGCYHDYGIRLDQHLVPFEVTKKTTLDDFECLRHEQKCIMMAFSKRMLKGVRDILYFTEKTYFRNRDILPVRS